MRKRRGQEEDIQGSNFSSLFSSQAFLTTLSLAISSPPLLASLLPVSYGKTPSLPNRSVRVSMASALAHSVSTGRPLRPSWAVHWPPLGLPLSIS